VFVGFLFTFSFIAFVVVTFWFPHVQEKCIDSTNGTWIANNMLAPALINIAMTQGNAQFLLAEHSCYSSQNKLRTEIAIEVEREILADTKLLSSCQAQHSTSLEVLELMAECVDVSNMTKMVTESCCGLKGYSTENCDHSSGYTCPIDKSTSPPSAYRPFETYMESPSCLEHLQEWTLLKDGNYECTNLNTACNHIPCNGVNDQWIHRYTTQTDCKAERWVLDSCRFLAAAIFHFIALYTICSLIYTGCRDLYWHQISPDSIRLRTHLLESGALAKGNELQDRLERIKNEIKWFERKARLQVFMGVILLLVYIVVVLMMTVGN